MELLVVIAIIALLMALLLPSLRTAKETAKTAVCLSNLKQICTAFNSYEIDHNQPIPAIAPFPSAPKAGIWWPASLAESGTAEGVVMCPTTSVSPPPTMGTLKGGQYDLSWFDGTQFPEAANKPEQSSYGHNMWYGNFDDALNPWGWKGQYPKSKHYLNSSGVMHAERTPVFADCVWVGGWPNRNNSEWPDANQRLQIDGPGSWSSGMSRFAIARHRGFRTLNVVHADGHAENMKPAGIWLLYWHKDSIPMEVDVPWD